MEKKSQHAHIPTFEEISQILDRTALRQEETYKIVRENALSLKETERLIKESQHKTDLQMQETDRKMKETDRKMQETDRQMKETDRRIKAMQQEIGGISKSSGEFAEEYFYNTFDNGEPLEFAGEHFDDIRRNLKMFDLKTKKEDEYDLVLYNSSKIAIIETKYKCRENNIEDVVRKVDTFRFRYPEYKNHKIYLGLAALTFDRNTIDKARKKGIAIIRQRGGKTVVYDKGLRAY